MRKIVRYLLVAFLLFVPSVVLGAEKKCVYTNDDSKTKLKITITVNTDSKKIKQTEILLNDDKNKDKEIKAESNYYEYNEIYKNGKCMEINEMYAVYYYVTQGGTVYVNRWDIKGEKGKGDSATSYKINFNKKETSKVNSDYKETENAETKDDDGYNAGMEVEGCDVVPEVIQKWIKIALNFIKYIALVLVVVLGTLDFIKAASSGEADGMKKAGQAFIKRLVAVILLFLLPMLVELILNLINLYGANTDCFGVLG